MIYGLNCVNVTVRVRGDVWVPKNKSHHQVVIVLCPIRDGELCRIKDEHGQHDDNTAHKAAGNYMLPKSEQRGSTCVQHTCGG